MYKCKHFGIKELVSPKVYKKFGDFSWVFFNDSVAKDLDTIREEWEIYCKANKIVSPYNLIINDGKQYTESGLRSNVDSIVVAKKEPYLSGHVLAKAFDIKPLNKEYKKFYDFMWKLLNSGKLIAFRRLEPFKHTPTWCHVDALRTLSDKPEIIVM